MGKISEARKNITQDEIKRAFDYRDGELIIKESRYSHLIGTSAGVARYLGFPRILRHLIWYKNIRFKRYQLVFLWHNGYIPDCIDHADRNTVNDRIENLREATHAQNMANTNKNKKSNSPYKGVTIEKGRANIRWRSKIMFDGKRISIGLFESEQAAALAYNRKAVEIYGEFANLNIIKPINKVSISDDNKFKFESYPIESIDNVVNLVWDFSNSMYNDLPTGEVTAFDMIKLYKSKFMELQDVLNHITRVQYSIQPPQYKPSNTISEIIGLIEEHKGHFKSKFAMEALLTKIKAKYDA